MSALIGDGEPAPRDAQLIGLLRPFDLIAKNVPREHRKQAKRRAKQIAETGPVSSAVHDAVTEVQTAIVVSVAASAAVSGGDGGSGGDGRRRRRRSAAAAAEATDAQAHGYYGSRSRHDVTPVCRSPDRQPGIADE